MKARKSSAEAHANGGGKKRSGAELKGSHAYPRAGQTLTLNFNSFAAFNSKL